MVRCKVCVFREHCVLHSEGAIACPKGRAETASWYWVATPSWKCYLLLTPEVAIQYRRLGWSVVPALPIWVAGQTAVDRQFEEVGR